MMQLLLSMPGGSEWVILLFFIALPVTILYFAIKYGIKYGMKSSIKDAVREMKKNGEI
jgi:hypothetical protein